MNISHLSRLFLAGICGNHFENNYAKFLLYTPFCTISQVVNDPEHEENVLICQKLVFLETNKNIDT